MFKMQDYYDYTEKFMQPQGEYLIREIDIRTPNISDTCGLSFRNESAPVPKEPFSHPVPAYIKMLRNDRREEENKYLRMAKGDEEEALTLWVNDMKKQISKAKIPKWLQNARCNV